MLKLVKMVSVLTVLLAVLTVSAAGYLRVFGNARINDRAYLLAKMSAIESFLKARGTTIPDNIQESPLVKQARELARRIDPPIVIPTTPDEAEKTTIKGSETPSVTPPPPPARYNLLATCIYEDFPEKSLALVDLIAKGHQWVRQGDKLNHLTVHKIDEGSVILYQNGREHSVMDLPQRAESKLLKSANVTAPGLEGIELIESIIKPILPNTKVKAPRPKTAHQPQPRIPPARPTPQKQPSTKETIAAIEGMIKATEALPGQDKQVDDMKVWAEVLKMLESTNKEEEKRKADKEKKASDKKK